MRGADYPFGVPAEPGLLLEDGSWATLSGDDAWADRIAVVAVGSNAVASVVHAKLAAAGVLGVVPFVPRAVRGVGIAHSAHVSRGGYLPTTAWAQPGASATMVVSWFGDEQLAALDATEPNFRRIRLSAGCGVPAAQAYVSRWGVFAPRGRPLEPTTQAEVHRVLASDPVLASWLPYSGPEAADALRDPGLGRRVRERLLALGWVRPTGL